VAKVSVSKGVLIGVLAVAAASLLALAFVLGRESGAGPPAPTTRIDRVAPRVQDAAPPASTPALIIGERSDPRTGIPAPLVLAQGGAPLPSAGQVFAASEGERGVAGADPARAAVAAYFDAVDHIQKGAMSGDADSVAQEMAAALANGDTSGLDKMIQQTESAKAGLAAITPPAPCADFHRESLASVDSGIEVLRTLKAAMNSSDPAGQLARVSAQATELRSRADALQKEELALRQRYGLKQ
jgi:hypothetical protein